METVVEEEEVEVVPEVQIFVTHFKKENAKEVTVVAFPMEVIKLN